MILDHYERALARRIQQWIGKPRFALLIRVYVAQIQELETALEDVRQARDLTIAKDTTNLDVAKKWSAFLAEPLRSSDPVVIMAWVLSKARSLRTSGEMDQLIEILRLAANNPDLIVELEDQPPATIKLGLPEPIDPLYFSVLQTRLRDSRAAGVALNATYVANGVAQDESFKFSDTNDTTADSGRGFGNALSGSIGGPFRGTFAP